MGGGAKRAGRRFAKIRRRTIRARLGCAGDPCVGKRHQEGKLGPSTATTPTRRTRSGTTTSPRRACRSGRSSSDHHLEQEPGQRPPPMNWRRCCRSGHRSRRRGAGRHLLRLRGGRSGRGRDVPGRRHPALELRLSELVRGVPQASQRQVRRGRYVQEAVRDPAGRLHVDLQERGVDADLRGQAGRGAPPARGSPRPPPDQARTPARGFPGQRFPSTRSKTAETCLSSRSRSNASSRSLEPRRDCTSGSEASRSLKSRPSSQTRIALRCTTT